MTDSQSTRPIVTFVTATVGLVALVVAEHVRDLPTFFFYIGVANFCAIMLLSLFKNGIIADLLDNQRYVVRRHYLDSQAEYKTLRRKKALEYAADLLDGMVDFVNENPQSEAAIAREYTVSISVSNRKNISSIVGDFQELLPLKFIQFLQKSDRYDMFARAIISQPRSEIRIAIEPKKVTA